MVFVLKDNAAWVGISGSLIASGLVILLQALLVDKLYVNQLESSITRKIE